MNPTSAIANPLSLEGRRILITGASFGIGRETAVLLSELGARLVICGRNKERLDETAGNLSGGGHLVECRDLDDLEGIPEWLRGIAERSEPLSGLVHSAGAVLTLPIRALTPSQADKIMRLNWGAAWVLAKAFRQKTVRAETGSIVYLSSVAGLVGEPGLSAYASSKGAVLALTRSLAMELASEKIRVNAVVPGLVKTGMGDDLANRRPPEQYEALLRQHPLGLGSARDVAHAIAFLLAETSRWITGTALTVDGG